MPDMYLEIAEEGESEAVAAAETADAGLVIVPARALGPGIHRSAGCIDLKVSRTAAVLAAAARGTAAGDTARSGRGLPENSPVTARIYQNRTADCCTGVTMGCGQNGR